MLSLWYFLYTMIGYCVTWELFSLKRDFQFLNLALHLLSSGQQLLMCALFFFPLLLIAEKTTFDVSLSQRMSDERRRLNLVTDTWQFLINFRTKWNRLLQFRNLISDKEYLKLGEIDIPQVGCSAFAVQLKKDWLIKNYTE